MSPAPRKPERPWLLRPGPMMSAAVGVGLALGAGMGALVDYPWLGAGMGVVHGAAVAIVIIVMVPK